MTITDILLWGEWLFLYPGKIVAAFVVATFPKLSYLFESTHSWIVFFFLSCLIWWLMLKIVYKTYKI